MAESKALTIWDPLQYLSPTELARLDEQFDSALTGTSCLVFWTGVPRGVVQRWAEQNGAKTLTSAMGPLFDDRGSSSARHGKSPKRWSRYMKGASGRFAQYACRGRQAIVLTNPPPHIYSPREGSTFRYMEEPILKGGFGGSSANRIDLVHPTVDGAADFRYQAWPLDKSWKWTLFFKNTLQKKLGDVLIKYTIPSCKNITQDIDGQEVAKDEHSKLDKGANELYKELEEQPTKVRIGNQQQQQQQQAQQQQAQERRDARRKKVEEQRKQAQERREAKQRKVEEQQKQAQEKREAKQRKVEEKQKQAQERRNAKQMKLSEEKEIKRKRVEEKGEFKRKRAEEKRDVKQKEVEAKRDVKRNKGTEDEERRLQGTNTPRNTLLCGDLMTLDIAYF